MGEDNTIDKQGVNKGHKWQPGESGNPAGRPPKGGSLTELMREYLDNPAEGHSKTRKEEFIAKVAMMAYNGDNVAVKLIWNYLDGMPKETVEATLKNEGVVVLPELNGNNMATKSGTADGSPDKK